MGSPYLCTRQKALKLGYFYWLRVKNSNNFYTCTELSLCYLKHTKFYPENRAYFIQISSIASFKPFLIAWLWGYCIFLDSSVVSVTPPPWPKYANTKLFPPQKKTKQNNHVLLSSNTFFIRLFLANT